MNIKKNEKCVERLDGLARHRIPGIENSDCSSSKTRVPHKLTFISMPNSEKINLCTSLKVLHNVHFRHFGELKMRFLLICQQVV